MNLLQIALVGNGIFSLLSGFYLVFYKGRVAQWFGKEKTTVFLLIGLGLLFFSYTIFVQIKRPDAEAVFYIIIQDLIWVLASIILLSLKPFNITHLGNQIIAGIALIVLLFGVVQSIGLMHIDASKEKGVKRLTFERAVMASKASSWQVLSDVSNYHEVAPNIDHVQIESGQGLGMVRSCSHKGDRWTELCTDWNEEDSYTFQVNTDAEDYPYPLNYLKGTWKVEEISKNQTNIVMEFEFSYKNKWHHLIVHPFVKKQFSKISEEILANWQERLEQ